MMTEAISPVTVKTSSIADNILPSRLRLVIPATDEEMEKNTKGIIAVKSKLRKMSPKGLKTTASFL
jgi:hypothetical protein